jgi:hypothetical protein
MRIVLKPFWIAEECFLLEAFLWVAFNRFPLSEIMPDHGDFRFDANRHDEYSPYIPDTHGYIESEEAIRAGLPRNPEWDALFDDTRIPDISFFDPDLSSSHDLFVEKITGKSISKEDREQSVRLAFSDLYPNVDFEEAKAEALKRSQAQKDWDEKYEECAELTKTKIYLALREGKIDAVGRHIPANFEENENFYWTMSEHVSIPADYWRLEGIDWKQSASNNKKGHYCHICVNTEQLMSAFPSPDPEQAKSIQIIADQYILNEEDASKPLPKGNRGRPSKNWDAFYAEAMFRVYEGDLPDKQDAFIAGMQEWCTKNWGGNIGRSTISEKISPFYNRYKKNRKNVRN